MSMRIGFGDCVFDSDTREVVRAGTILPLSPKAFQLLGLLLRERPKAVSKERLHRELWPDTFVADANLANLVGDLRAALGDDARHPRLIRTVQRFGYAFEGEAERVAPAAGGARRVIDRLVWGDREIALQDGENVLGRDEASVAWIDAYSVSRQHARIHILGKSATLEDLDSKNGTFLNGEPVRAKPVRLSDGDHIRLGTVELVYRRFQAGETTHTARGS
jgi:DNA-binding winged helix-turn-helix (wHTH) protein